MTLDQLVRERRVNAAVGWAMVGIVVLVAVESLLTDAVLWGVFALLLGVVASLPALTKADWKALAPWPVLLVAAAAVTARAVELYAETAGYLAIALLALLIVVELDAFSAVELSRWFAVLFAVLTTMAIEALWIVAQFYSDVWLGTGFLTTQTELQEDIVAVTVVGFAAGALFYWYFERVEPAGTSSRPSEEVEAR